MQIASLPASGLVVGVQVGNVGSDRGLAEPMAAALAARYGHRARRYLVDGGFQCAADIEAAHAAGTDPYRVRKTDGPGVATWRTRMATPQVQAVVQRRARCELIHAHLRNLSLDRLRVRGLRKVQNWMSGFALALNILTERRLRAARPA